MPRSDSMLGLVLVEDDNGKHIAIVHKGKQTPITKTLPHDTSDDRVIERFGAALLINQR
jgi:hypothetical protein